MYEDARINAGLSRKKAAELLHVGERTLYDYEKQITVPMPDVVCQMARLYKSNWLTQWHCRTRCEIGYKYSYIILNNVDDSLIGIISSLEEELEEALEAVKYLKRFLRNKQSREDFSMIDLGILEDKLGQVLDAEHNAEVLKIKLDGIIDSQDVIDRHNQKCLEKGYVKKMPATQIFVASN